MTTGSILLTIALLVVLLLYLLRPFFAATTTEQFTPRQKLLSQKESILEQIRVLDFDHTTGKLPDEVYEPQRAHLVREAAIVLQKLEASAVDSADDIDTAIETAVARLRQSPSGQTTTPTTSTPGGYCSQCGEPVADTDNFCAVCGHKVRETVHA